MASYSIPLEIRNLPSGIVYPLFSGVPFQRGILWDLRNLEVDENFVVITAQFETLCTWPDGSIKMVLVGFNADASKSYRLNLNDTLSPIYSSVEAPTFAGNIYYTQDGVTYDTDNDATQQETVVVSGPIRTVKKITGIFTAAGGATFGDSSGKLAYTIYLTAYANQTFQHLDVTLIDNRPVLIDGSGNWAPYGIKATEYGYSLPFNGNNYCIGGESDVEYTGAISGTHYLYQTGQLVFRLINNGSTHQLYRKVQTYSGVGTGLRAPGWAASYDNSNNSLMVSLQDFWQQLPKKLAIDATKIDIKFHPSEYVSEADDPTNSLPRSRYFYHSQPGVAKTYRLLIDRGTYDLSRVKLLQACHQAEARHQAPGKYICDSKVFGDLVQAGNANGQSTYGYDYSLIHDNYDLSFQAAFDNPETGSINVVYTWRDYGDRLRPDDAQSFYNDTHIGSHQWAIEYLRNIGINTSREDKWYKLWNIAYKHFMDIDVCHSVRSGYWDLNGKPGLPKGEPHVIKHDMPNHEDKAHHAGHVHLSGLVEAWFLKGDFRAKEVLDELGVFYVAFYGGAETNPVTPNPYELTPHRGGEHRSPAWPLFCLNWLYKATNDQTYLNAAASMVATNVNWWKTPKDATYYDATYGVTVAYNHHFRRGVDYGPNDYENGTGFLYCYPYQENRSGEAAMPGVANGPSPWMLFPLLAEMIHFLRLDEFGINRNHAEVWDCVLQCIQYVFTNCYDSTNKAFAYAEGFTLPYADKRPTGSVYAIAMALRYLSIATVAEVPHPEWYTTTALWQTWLDNVYSKYTTYTFAGNTSQGFYGYEEITPSDGILIDKRMRSPLTALAYGEKLPYLGETKTAWGEWEDGAGNPVPILGDASYGRITTGGTSVLQSGVKTLGSPGVVRNLTINRDQYGGGVHRMDIYIRGADEVFGKDDVVIPAWQRYLGPVSRQWAYVQIRLTYV